MKSFRLANFGTRISQAVPGWFTLAELIVVITILAILATVGFLSLQGYSTDAKDSKILANMRSVHTSISTESLVTGSSPRKYVVHDSTAALTGAYFYADGNPTALTGGDWNQSGTNYSAGNPNWTALRLNPEKFRVSQSPFSMFPQSFAALSSDQPIVGAFDFTDGPAWKKRTKSAFQIWALLGSRKAVIVGDYSASSGSVAGLIRADALVGGSGTGALVEDAVLSWPAGCVATTQSGYPIAPLSNGASATFTKSVTNGTGSLSASCSNGGLTYGTESYVCSSPYYWNGNACANMYTVTSGNANYSVTLPKDWSAYWYTVGRAKENGYVRFEIQRVGDTYGYGGIYLDDRQAFFPREYGNIDKDPYFNSSPRYSSQWIETGVDTSNNGASGYATIWVNKGETIKLMGHRSTMTITANLVGATPSWYD